MSDGFKPCSRCGSLYETLTTRGPACSKCEASKDYGDDPVSRLGAACTDATLTIKTDDGERKHIGDIANLSLSVEHDTDGYLNRPAGYPPNHPMNNRISHEPMPDDIDDDSLTVTIDGKEWTPANDDTAEYDAIHAVAGAVLAGAENVEVTRGNDE